MASYALSKSALQGMARGLARDFGPRGITITIVQIGPIDTDTNPEGQTVVSKHGASLLSIKSEALLRQLEPRTTRRAS